MDNLHHPFEIEFLDHSDAIRSLKLADERFSTQFKEYHALDDRICRIEEYVEYASDQEIDELKFKRAKLKDTLYAAVQKQEAMIPPRATA